jgi:hypothetical protein
MPSFLALMNFGILLAVVSELRRNHCEQTNDLLSSRREDHVMGCHRFDFTSCSPLSVNKRGIVLFYLLLYLLSVSFNNRTTF